MQQEYLPIKLSKTEERDMIDLARANRSFYDVWKHKIDMTYVILNELSEILHGRVKRSFCINIRSNVIGARTGTFKSSLGCQLARYLDPTFTVEERLAFTPNTLIEKVKKYATQKQVFLMDEFVRDLKVSAELRLANLIEATRERQLCFILIGTLDKNLVMSDYHFERMGESDNSYFDKKIKVFGEEMYTGRKTVYFLIRKITEFHKIYRGYFKWNITSLEDKNWREFWEEYMVLKREHQQSAIEASLTGFNFKREAQNVIDDARFQGVYDEHGRMIRGKVRNLIYEMYPDNTKLERDYVYQEVLRPSKISEEEAGL